MASPWMLMRWAQCMERSPVTGMMAATEHIKETWCLIQMDGTVASCIWEGGWLWCSRVRCNVFGVMYGKVLVLVAM